MTSHKLDRARPIGEVVGQPGVKWEQDGHLYKSNGDPVNAAKLIPVNDEPTPPSPRDDTPIKPAVVIEAPPGAEDAKPQSIEEMHWTKLKVLVEANGGVWSNRADAVEFLKGKG